MSIVVSTTNHLEKQEKLADVIVRDNIWMISESAHYIRDNLDFKRCDWLRLDKGYSRGQDAICEVLKIWQLFLTEIAVCAEIAQIAFTFLDSCKT
jgi:hypothetical protein